MSNPRQIEANRRNSQLSTGPRTPEGKAVSRFNALRTGINAKAQVIPGEDPAELEAIAAGYHQEWAPATQLECFLVDSLIRADWLLRRLARLEAELWTHEIEEARKNTPPKSDETTLLGHIYGRSCDHFTRLQRRIDSAERSYFRALTQLQRLRAAAESTSDAQPAPDPWPPAPEPELASFCPIPDLPSLAAPPPGVPSPCAPDDRLIR